MNCRFELHPQLAADCHLLGQLGNAHLLLHRNASVPWFILVPEVAQEEFLELDTAIQAELLADCSRLGAFIKCRFDCPKLNFGAIGNVVPQLHLHVVGRRAEDACWPAPVWGNLKDATRYSEKDLTALRNALADELRLQ